jgi:signal peptidase I
MNAKFATGALLIWALVLSGVIGPTALGGPATYVSTYGISMQPSFKAGDLAVLKPAATYSVGDVAGYEADTLNRTLVMHRIVDTDGDRFVFQGDNNSWLDPDTPTEDQIVGKLWFQIPGGGIWLTRLTSPPVIAALAFLILLTLTGTAAYARRGRRRRRTMAGVQPTSQFDPWWSLPPGARTAISVFGAVAGLGLLLGLFAWTRPTTTVTTEEVEQPKEVVFSYAATVPPTPAYESTEARSPNPIFRSVANDVKASYTYRGDPGTAEVVARLSTGGWQWTVPLSTPTDFTESPHEQTVRLDLAELERRAQEGTTAAGISMGTVAVSVIPIITTADGEFRPELKMNLSPTEFSLAGDEASLTVSESTTVTKQTTEPNQITFLSWSIDVGLARILSLVMLLIGAAGVGIAFFTARKGPAMQESDVIRNRYKELLVTVRELPAADGRVIEVPDIESLAKIAKRYALMILHLPEPGSDTYVVQDESTTYRYRSSQWAAPHPFTPHHAGPGAAPPPNGDPFSPPPSGDPFAAPPNGDLFPPPNGTPEAPAPHHAAPAHAPAGTRPNGPESWPPPPPGSPPFGTAPTSGPQPVQTPEP